MSICAHKTLIKDYINQWTLQASHVSLFEHVYITFGYENKRFMDLVAQNQSRHK